MATAPAGILIVEDEVLLAMSLRLLIDDGDEFYVTGDATSMAGVRTALAVERPALALVDIRLANNESGLDVARALRDEAIPVLLMGGIPPESPVRHLALGCIAKPFADADMRRALAIALQIANGDPPPGNLPPALQLY